MVSHPELGSDPPIGSDRESGCDKLLGRQPKLSNKDFMHFFSFPLSIFSYFIFYVF